MNKKYILGVAITAMALTSCVNDDSDLSDLEDNVEVKDIAFDYTSLSETDNFESEYPDEYVENSEFTRTVYVKFNGNSVELSGETADLETTVDGAHVTITPSKKKMEFVLSGTTTDGGVKFYSENKFKVVLDGVEINNPTGPAINSQCKKRMFLVLNDENKFSDGTSYTASGDEDMKGTIFSEGKIIFSGDGTLKINSNCKHSIASDDYIIVRPGVNISVDNVAASCIKGKDGVTILGGVLNMSTTAAGGKGISSDADIEIKGGRTTIETTGESLIEDADTTSAACIKCDYAYTQTGGTVNLKSIGEGGKCLNIGGTVTISGGELNGVAIGTKILSSPKALKTDGGISMSTAVYLYSKHSSACDATGNVTIAPGYSSLAQTKHLLELKY